MKMNPKDLESNTAHLNMLLKERDFFARVVDQKKNVGKLAIRVWAGEETVFEKKKRFESF